MGERPGVLSLLTLLKTTQMWGSESSGTFPSISLSWNVSGEKGLPVLKEWEKMLRDPTATTTHTEISLGGGHALHFSCGTDPRIWLWTHEICPH